MNKAVFRGIIIVTTLEMLVLGGVRLAMARRATHDGVSGVVGNAVNGFI